MNELKFYKDKVNMPNDSRLLLNTAVLYKTTTTTDFN